MNHESKKLLFNKSTLLSLKAELLKKQEEVKGKKQLPQHKVENYKPPPASRPSPSSQHETFKEKLESVVDVDELEAHKRSKAALEKKAELYAHLSDGAGTSQLTERFLVDFHSKKQEDRRTEEGQAREKRAQSEEKDAAYQPDDDDDDDWTEFTDCLGRTRKCLKTDLDLYHKRDKQIKKSLGVDDIQENTAAKLPAEDLTEKDNEEIGPPPPTDKPLLVQKTDEYLQSLRAKWEQKERELLERDRDVHYQDLLFDEARAHGVGYFNFSTEEAARRAQQTAFERTRMETTKAQEEATRRRERRDAMVAERVAAARRRQRERAGLPPEDEGAKSTEEFQLSSLLDFLTEQKSEAARKAKEQEVRAREERERERQKQREQYVREWDRGKEGADGDKKEFRELTQEEYEEQQRSKRIDEFAPPQMYNGSDGVFDRGGNFVASHRPPPAVKTWAEVRPVQRQADIEDIPTTSRPGLYFSSKEERKNSNMSKSTSRLHEERSRSPTSEPVPIVNELDEHEPIKKVSKRNAGAEVEPPPTYDYYGPEAKRTRTKPPPDMREAYEQGLRFLHEMESKKRKNLDSALQ